MILGFESSDWYGRKRYATAYNPSLRRKLPPSGFCPSMPASWLDSEIENREVGNMVNKTKEYEQRVGIIDGVIKKHKITDWEQSFLKSCKRHFKNHRELSDSMRHFYITIMEKYNYGR